MIFPRSPLPAFANINLRPFLSPSTLSTFSSFTYNTILILMYTLGTVNLPKPSPARNY